MSEERSVLTSETAEVRFAVIEGSLIVEYWGSPIKAFGKEISLAREGSITNSGFDSLMHPGVMRESSRGFLGRPALSGHRNGKSWSTKFEVKTISQKENQLSVSLNDAHAELEINLKFTLDKFGVLKQSATVLNLGVESYTLNEFIFWLPLPREATQTLDFAGRWSNERQPQRSDIDFGTWVREVREGRTGHYSTITQIALTKESNFQSGSVWAVSLGWSGNSHYLVEKMYDGSQSIGAGELLLPGEVILNQGDTYEAPDLFCVFSASGLDGVTHSFHEHIRARTQHPKRPRPLSLNLWEAIWFDHDEARIKNIVDTAADIGVERIVLDDGWFLKRRDDRAGLGDWVIDPAVWPQGLTPIIDYVNKKGIEFGLWFEGEMVNPDSEVYRSHPDWILKIGDRIPPLWRHQLVLNLAIPEAFSHVLEQTSKILSENNISYIKWDHNRALVDAGTHELAGVRSQTLALYKLFDELKNRYPSLEIESCASGGARIDLGILDRVDRFWTSDNNDALERQTIQRWTSQVIPPELLGTHIGPTHGHQTGRTIDLSFRAITALFGHAGIEWDITKASDKEREQLKSWIAYYKEKRDLLHSGNSLRADYPDPHGYLYGVVNSACTTAIFAYAQITTTVAVNPAPLKIPGLKANQKYDVKAVFPSGEPRYMLIEKPKWMNGITISGSALAEVGLSAPILAPANGFLIEIDEA